jgi:hypothetical protein
MTYNTLQIKPKKLKMAIFAVTNPIFRVNYYFKPQFQQLIPIAIGTLAMSLKKPFQYFCTKRVSIKKLILFTSRNQLLSPKLLEFLLIFFLLRLRKTADHRLLLGCISLIHEPQLLRLGFSRQLIL